MSKPYIVIQIVDGNVVKVLKRETFDKAANLVADLVMKKNPQYDKEILLKEIKAYADYKEENGDKIVIEQWEDGE